MSLGQGGDSAGAALTSVAQSGDASYELRAQSAEALRAVPGAHSFASRELTLLASRSVSAEQADKPYFVRAREYAAQSAPAAARPRILRAAIGFAPSDLLRLSLFKAEVAAGEDDRALAALTPLMTDNRGYNYRYSYRSDTGNLSAGIDSSGPEAVNTGQQAEADEGDSTSSDSEQVSPVAIPVIVSSRAEKLAFSLEVAKMHERLGQDSEAVTWLTQAAKLTSDGTEKAMLIKRLDAARQRIEIAEDNDSRRPVVQASIDQAILVRPRLSAARAGGRP
jgi:hypothetical protein